MRLHYNNLAIESTTDQNSEDVRFKIDGGVKGTHILKYLIKDCFEKTELRV